MQCISLVLQLSEQRQNEAIKISNIRILVGFFLFTIQYFYFASLYLPYTDLN